MKIEFLGAVRTVTGSMHLLTINDTRILLDCGLYQGRREESFERNRNLPFNPAEIDVLILSHAHIDHAGNIPSLVKNGFNGFIFSTPATRDLCAVMLRDSANIQEADAAFVNKQRRGQQPPVQPLYTANDVENCLGQFVSIGYGRSFPVAPGVRLTFYEAGHILGSAMVCLDVSENGQRRRLLFSGDIGRPGASLLRDPATPSDVNVLIMESTYGGRLHGSPDDRMLKLAEIVNETVRRGGKVIVPSFALGRTQDIVYSLHQLLDQGQIPALPVYVDSPLAVNATEVFLLHSDCYDQETRQFLISSASRSPFSFSNLYYIREVEESKALNDQDRPCIIISASGMCESGRILHHLKNNIQDERNTVIIVGWQAPDTLGRRLADRAARVKIFGQEYERRAEVRMINGYSAHADRDELLGWFKQVQNPGIESVFVVHGDPEASNALADVLAQQDHLPVVVPELGQQVTI